MEIWIDTIEDKLYMSGSAIDGDVFDIIRWCCITIDSAGGAYGVYRMLPGGFASEQDPKTFIATKSIRHLIVRDLKASESISIDWQARIKDRIALSSEGKRNQ